jgi:hypothetical protein
LVTCVNLIEVEAVGVDGSGDAGRQLEQDVAPSVKMALESRPRYTQCYDFKIFSVLVAFPKVRVEQFDVWRQKSTYSMNVRF